MLPYIFLALYVIVSGIHLYHSWLDSPKRRYSKPFLLILLILYYVFSADKLSWALMCVAAED